MKITNIIAAKTTSSNQSH